MLGCGLSSPPYRSVDDPKAQTELTAQNQSQPLGPDPLQAIRRKLSQLGEWAHSTQEGFKALQENQDLFAAELAAHQAAQAAFQAQQEAAAIDVVMGYRPSPEQLMGLFEALAEWQHGAPEVEKSATANFQTKEGEGRERKEVSYAYATPGEVSALARTAGKFGLGHFHREIVHSNCSAVRTYLTHKGGGFIYSDVPLLTRENRLLSPMQVWSVANTSARRLGLLSVMGIMPSDTDDAGNSLQPEGQASGRGRSTRPAGSATDMGIRKPPPLPAENIRRIGAPSPAAAPTAAATASTAPIEQTA